MIEMLYRGKRLDNGFFIEGWAMPFTNGGYEGKDNRMCIKNGMYASDTYEVDPETIGRYSGIHDKKGNKIFEGDILRFCDDNTGFNDAVVCYGEYKDKNWDFNEPAIGWYFVIDFGIFSITNGVSEDVDITESAEVIGNIYDTPIKLYDIQFGVKNDANA